MKTFCCILVFVFATFIAGSAHAQPSPGNNPNLCESCNGYATCQYGTPYGGCGCISGYDKTRGGYACAYCGFCLGKICFYSCGPFHSAVATLPAWTTDTSLSGKVELHSRIMAAILDRVQLSAQKRQCAMLRGTWKGDDGVKATWSAVQTTTGGITILSSYDGHVEQLFIESTGWGLARDNENVYGEPFVKQ